MNARWLIILAVVAFTRADACKGKLLAAANDQIDQEQIGQYLDSHFDEVDSNTPIRSYRRYGSESQGSVEIEFSPHNVVDGIDIYYSLYCYKNYQSPWSCQELEEKRSVSFDHPTDFVDVPDDMSLDEAKSIVESIKREIVIDEHGRYKYRKWETERVSRDPLNLLRINRTEGDSYEVPVWSGGACSTHVIEVRRIPCGVGTCSFEILRNEATGY